MSNTVRVQEYGNLKGPMVYRWRTDGAGTGLRDQWQVFASRILLNLLHRCHLSAISLRSSSPDVCCDRLFSGEGARSRAICTEQYASICSLLAKTDRSKKQHFHLFAAEDTALEFRCLWWFGTTLIRRSITRPALLDVFTYHSNLRYGATTKNNQHPG